MASFVSAGIRLLQSWLSLSTNHQVMRGGQYVSSSISATRIALLLSPFDQNHCSDVFMSLFMHQRKFSFHCNYSNSKQAKRHSTESRPPAHRTPSAREIVFASNSFRLWLTRTLLVVLHLVRKQVDIFGRRPYPCSPLSSDEYSGGGYLATRSSGCMDEGHVV